MCLRRKVARDQLHHRADSWHFLRRPRSWHSADLAHRRSISMSLAAYGEFHNSSAHTLQEHTHQYVNMACVFECLHAMALIAIGEARRSPSVSVLSGFATSLWMVYSCRL
jgi:hypothetical protein